jgi:hypothetical protein
MELPPNSGAPLAIEYEMIFRAIARNRAAGGRRKMRREDEPPAVSVLLEELDTRQFSSHVGPAMLSLAAAVFL